MKQPDIALRSWNLDAPIHPADNGLINHTWLVGSPPNAVLQWVNPIFSPLVNQDIAAITRHLRKQNLCTTELLPTAKGALWEDDDSGCWRLMTFVPGRTIHRLNKPKHAHAAGMLVGRFHSALQDCEHQFVSPRRDAHNTPARMRALQNAIQNRGEHPLATPAQELSAAIQEDWSKWSGDLQAPLRLCHGDLKVSNLRFSDDLSQAVSVIDLDTLGHMSLSVEMGDAWRSWCNPAGEDNPDDCQFQLELFEASALGWLETAPTMSSEERASLVFGIERICLELAARFCADAIENTYFREDRARFAQPGAHNLLKARCQLALARSARRQQNHCAKILRTHA